MIAIDKVDLKMKLFAGDSFEVDGLIIPPLTLKEIKDIGYTKYMQYLNVLVANPQQADALKDMSSEVEVNMFDIAMLADENEMKQFFIEAVKIFFKVDQAEYLPNYHIMLLGDLKDVANENMLITRDNFLKIQKVLKWQNCLETPENSMGSEADAKTKAILEKLRKSKETVNKIKAQKGESTDDDVDFVDILSAISTKSHNINKQNIWEFTVYQIYDEFHRLRMIEDFEIGIESILAGATDVELKHWSSNVDTNVEK